MKMSTLNKSAFDLHSKHYKARTTINYIPTNSLGNRTGKSTNSRYIVNSSARYY